MVSRLMDLTETIYVDMDDVLCQTARSLLIIIEREFGKRLSYEQLITYDLGQACGLRPEEVTELFRIIHRRDELLGMEPMEGGIAALQQWRAAEYEIAVVTGRPPSTYEPSVEWLARHQVPYGSFVVVDKYGRFETQNTIGITLSELAARQFSFAVEDSLTMADYLANQMDTQVALLDCPWNQSHVEHGRIGRYNDWREIARALPKRRRVGASR